MKDDGKIVGRIDLENLVYFGARLWKTIPPTCLAFSRFSVASLTKRVSARRALTQASVYDQHVPHGNEVRGPSVTVATASLFVRPRVLRESWPEHPEILKKTVGVERFIVERSVLDLGNGGFDMQS